ncbi:MAG: hypothetical protein MMC33_002785 [Icmadophila ericetorum]|nr:hypothetical protein [Icmadophila ericetorum]
MATAENMAHFNFMPDVSKIIVVNVKYFDGSEMIYIPHNIYIAGGHIVKLEMYDSEAFSKRVGSSPMETEVFSSLDSSTLIAMDMATFPLALLRALCKIAGQNGLSDIRCCGIGASTRASNWAVGGLIQNPKDAVTFIRTQVSQGTNYCKVVMDDDYPPGMVPFDMETLQALVHTAHENGKMMIAHACTIQPYRDAITVELDIITQSPMDEALDPITTSTMRNPAVAKGAKFDFRNPIKSVKAMYRAGTDILVGTDSNAAEVSPGHPMHGVSIHLEMELLVSAGMKPLDVLRAAASKPAGVFGLVDRGVIKRGKRADLVLIANDPTVNIQATRMIKQV